MSSASVKPAGPRPAVPSGERWSHRLDFSLSLVAVLLVQLVARGAAEEPDTAHILLSFGCLVLIAMLAGRQFVRRKFSADRWLIMLLWVAAVGAIVCEDWFLSALLTVWDSRIRTPASVIGLLLSGGGFLTGTYFVYSRRQVLLRRVRDINPHERDPDPCDALIVFLSNLRKVTIRNGDLYTGMSAEPIRLAERCTTEDWRHSKEDDWSRVFGEVGSGPPSSWEMPLRAIGYHAIHKDRPKEHPVYVYLVCSAESAPQARAFVRLLRVAIPREMAKFFAWVGIGPDDYIEEDYLAVLEAALADGSGDHANGTETEQWAEAARKVADITRRLRQWVRAKRPATPEEELPDTAGLGFEDIEMLWQAFESMLHAIPRRSVVHGEERLVIDVTGGQKIGSIVGALITLDRPMKAQYVQTNPPKRVRTYDLHTEPEEMPAHG